MGAQSHTWRKISSSSNRRRRRRRSASTSDGTTRCGPRSATSSTCPRASSGVDIERDFEPEYHVIPGKAKVIDELRRRPRRRTTSTSRPTRIGRVRRSPGTSPTADRAAEERPPRPVQRDHQGRGAGGDQEPAELDRNKFDAQQARRVLDRLVGYQVSPLLWKKVRRGLSAGRVQSVAVRIIIEREREIRAFVKEEYWTIAAELEGTLPPPFTANLLELAGKRLDHKAFRLENAEAAHGVVQHLDGASGSSARSRKRSASATRRRRSSPRGCSRRPRASSGSARGARWGSRSGSTRASSSARRARSVSSPTCAPTRRASPPRRSRRSATSSRRATATTTCPRSRTSTARRRAAQDAHEAIRPTSIEYDPERVARYPRRTSSSSTP